jgi:hypothetical protein
MAHVLGRAGRGRWTTLNIPGQDCWNSSAPPRILAGREEIWHFCCADPMAYEGEAKSRADFAAYGDAHRVFLNIA